MNIQQFYQKTAVISLNASLIALVPPLFLVIFGMIAVPNRQYILFITPFLLYSFYCYQFYLVNARRSKEVSVSLTSGRNLTKLLDANELLISFLPAPSLRMIIFEKNGQQIGEIRDLQYWTFRFGLPYCLDKLLGKEYGLFDELDQLVATFLIKKDSIEISPLNEKALYIEKLPYSGKELTFTTGGQSLTIRQSVLFTDYQIYKDEMMICRLRKGWLPVEWGKRFIDPNTPVLTLANTINEKEKLMIFAVLSERLRYTDH